MKTTKTPAALKPGYLATITPQFGPHQGKPIILPATRKRVLFATLAGAKFSLSQQNIGMDAHGKVIDREGNIIWTIQL